MSAEKIFGMYNPGDLRIRTEEPNRESAKHFRVLTPGEKLRRNEEKLFDFIEHLYTHGGPPEIEDEESEITATTFSVNGFKAHR